MYSVFRLRLIRNSFTLIELIVVLLIIGILATLGFRSYGLSIEKNKANEAKNNLLLIRAAERIYYSEYGNYYTTAGDDDFGHDGNEGNVNLRLDLNDSTGTNWNYNLLDPGATDQFDATAARLSGSFAGCVYLITHSSDTIVEDSTSTGCAE